MANQTPRYKAPYILSTQSQKEVTHNMALNLLDMLIQPSVETMSLSTPPITPAEGQLWLVGATATGDWLGQDNNVAQFLGGSWNFHVPSEGFSVWLKDNGVAARFLSGLWQVGRLKATSVEISGQQVIGPRQTAISDASGGITIDSEARASLNGLLAACRAHGLIAP